MEKRASMFIIILTPIYTISYLQFRLSILFMLPPILETLAAFR